MTRLSLFVYIFHVLLCGICSCGQPHHTTYSCSNFSPYTGPPTAPAAAPRLMPVRVAVAPIVPADNPIIPSIFKIFLARSIP